MWPTAEQINTAITVNLFVFIQGLMCLSCGALYNPAPLHGLSAEKSWIESFCSRKVAAPVQHAPSVRIKTQENQKIHGVQQKLPGHPHTAAQRRVCGVHAFGGEHGPGMSGGSRAETRVTRGRLLDVPWLLLGLIWSKSP